LLYKLISVGNGTELLFVNGNNDIVHMLVFTETYNAVQMFTEVGWFKSMFSWNGSTKIHSSYGISDFQKLNFWITPSSLWTYAVHGCDLLFRAWLCIT